MATRPTPLERAVDRIPFLEKELFLLSRLVRPGDVCVDVGAAGGAHLLVMAARAGRGGRVLGIEPRPGSLKIVEGVVRAVGLAQRVTLVQAALSDRTGRVVLRVPVVPTRAHLRGTARDRDRHAAFTSLPARRISVPTRRLDDVVGDAGLTRVDVVKCDVEGAELLVLAGAPRLLAEQRPVLLIEADDLHQRRFDSTAARVLETVVRHDYVPYRYARGRLERVPGVVEAEDDYVLVPWERRREVAGRLAA